MTEDSLVEKPARAEQTEMGSQVSTQKKRGRRVEKGRRGTRQCKEKPGQDEHMRHKDTSQTKETRGMHLGGRGSGWPDPE